MATLIELTKLSGGPGSLRLLLLLLAAGFTILVALPRRRRAAITGLASVTLAYLVMATPAAADLTMRILPESAPVEDSDIQDIQTLFFFDGDNRFGRVREFERIYRVARLERIYMLGRLSVYKDLRLMGIPSRQIEHDETPDNTSDQIRRTVAALAAGESGRAAILASCLQAPRVRLLAGQAGLNLPVLAAPLDEDLPKAGIGRFVPSFAALAVTRDALYEVAALAYYRR